jgi:ribonuclease BN (tRNA processing enzyme)
MVVTVQFVGTGDAFGTGGRLQACISVRWPAGHVLLDCGATSLVGLKRLGVDPGSVDAVLVSHLHGDHFGGLPFLILDQQFARRERPLLVAGPAGLGDRLHAAMEVLFPGSSGVRRRFPIEVQEFAPATESYVGPATVTPYPVEHASGAPALGLRLTCDDRVIAYSGDTAWTDTLVDVARDADVFVCEAYSVERVIRYHLDFATLRANRARLSCRRLVLTHLGPEALARRAELDAEVAEDGLVLHL